MAHLKANTKRSQVGDPPMQPDNPFKRSGPGARHAAQLQLALQPSAHTQARCYIKADPADHKLPIPPNCTAFWDGRSIKADEGCTTDQLQAAHPTFSRCRIAPVQRICNTGMKREFDHKEDLCTASTGIKFSRRHASNTRRPRPANVDHAESDMPVLTKSHSRVASGSGGLETRPAQPCRAPSAPSLPAKTVSGEGTCSMPAKPLQGQVPGVVFRYSISTDQASVQYMDRRLQRYRRLHDDLRKQGRSKPDLIANKELRSSQPQRYLGHPLGVQPGDLFEGRGELAALGIHSLMAAGIDWHGAHPAFAVCLSGGYADDEDTGAQIWYTGMGGQRKQQQVQPQQLEKGNLALKTSMDLQTPVRVCRAASERERDGATYRMYSYAGLYIVKQMKRVKSIDGPEVYKFQLVAVAGHAVEATPVKFNHFSSNHVKVRCQRALRELMRKKVR